jgi:hypothetical protein
MKIINLDIFGYAFSFNLKGHDATVQTIVSLSPANEYEEAKTLLITESLVRLNENSIFLLGRMPNEAKEQAEEICRCKDIVENHRIDLDQEITEYRNSQINQSKRISEKDFKPDKILQALDL